MVLFSLLSRSCLDFFLFKFTLFPLTPLLISCSQSCFPPFHTLPPLPFTLFLLLLFIFSLFSRLTLKVAECQLVYSEVELLHALLFLPLLALRRIFQLRQEPSGFPSSGWVLQLGKKVLEV